MVMRSYRIFPCCDFIILSFGENISVYTNQFVIFEENICPRVAFKIETLTTGKGKCLLKRRMRRWPDKGVFNKQNVRERSPEIHVF